ncbi:MAG TPA: FecR family protein, partial [Thermoanaerobaculia bacterium]|nr:FecR family protein [Thermoanaerobaculia bacterium]
MRRALAPLALGLLLAASALAQPLPPPQQQPEAYDTPESSAAPAPAAEEPQAQPAAGSYGYLRLVEGSATIIPASSGNTAAAEVNQPIMAGDRISVPQRGRVEVVLADHNIVRLDGDTQVAFTRLANSADRQDAATELRLDAGNLQLIVTQDSVGQELPTVLTPNASVYIQAYGSYRITSDRGDFTAVVVRRGTAEVVSDSGDNPVHAGEEAIVDRQRQAGIDVRQAGGFDALERWARQLDDETRVAQSSYVDPSLSYESAPLDRYGHWINSDGRQYWQPNEADSGWSPYWEGHWDSTPSGQFWVSSEPWGWVPYHYGTWDYLPTYGWAWQPGYAFAPSWVYWYWGPSYVGWCPIGFYTGFYGGFFGGFRFGHYGWA